jgi:hypothetical protein
MFLVLMAIGLVGLAVMAVPAFGRHGGPLHGTHALRSGHLAGLAASGRGPTAALIGAGQVAAAGHVAVGHVGPSGGADPTGLVRREPRPGLARFLPSPRLVFSLLALYGAFGNVLRAAHLTMLTAAVVAVLPAALVERFVVTPVWRLLFRFQAPPSAPLEELILSEATAVTPFRNGRGIVSTIRDGRLVQFSARLVDAQARTPVKVGDRLRVEDLDPKNERLTVSVMGE